MNEEKEKETRKLTSGERDFDLFKMRLLVAFALLLLVVAVAAASADTLPPPTAVSSTGKGVQIPADSTAELTGPRRCFFWGGARGRDFEFFEMLDRRSKKKKAAPFPAL